MKLWAEARTATLPWRYSCRSIPTQRGSLGDPLACASTFEREYGSEARLDNGRPGSSSPHCRAPPKPIGSQVSGTVWRAYSMPTEEQRGDGLLGESQTEDNHCRRSGGRVLIKSDHAAT